MSAFPKKCIPINNAEAYRAINKRLIGQYVSFQVGSEAAVFGKVKSVIVQRLTKSVTLTLNGKDLRLDGFHADAYFTLKRYRNELHFKSELDRLKIR